MLAGAIAQVRMGLERSMLSVPVPSQEKRGRRPVARSAIIGSERKFNLSIQPALAYEDVSMLESSAKHEQQQL